MENNIIDIFTDEPQSVHYASFKTRVIATILDALILAPITYGLSYVVLMYVKWLVLSLCITLTLPLYKCFMEKKYGATFGKKIMKIVVVTEDFKTLTYKEVFLRNYYYFLGLIVACKGYYILYTNPAFQTTTTFSALWVLKEETVPMPHKILKYALSAILFLDNLWMLKNSSNQTLHDRLGKTVVIQK